jgi:hypothetical protein
VETDDDIRAVLRDHMIAEKAAEMIGARAAR